MGRYTRCWLSALATVAALAPGAAFGNEAAWNAHRSGGVVVLMRHARAPGVGDPASFKLDDCATQRNLSDAGRAQARSVGEAFRMRGIRVDRVLSSAWCRSIETARLAFGDVEVFAPLNSFFGDRKDEPEQTRLVLAEIKAWSGLGVLALVTHQVNVTALVREFPQEGEVLVLKPASDGLRLVGRISTSLP
jgi:phosphohistidine phosphatase SixA